MRFGLCLVLVATLFLPNTACSEKIYEPPALLMYEPANLADGKAFEYQTAADKLCYPQAANAAPQERDEVYVGCMRDELSEFGFEVFSSKELPAQRPLPVIRDGGSRTAT